MEAVLSLIALAARAADERQTAPEAPGENAGRAALLTSLLLGRPSGASEDDATALFQLARELAGGVCAALAEDMSRGAEGRFSSLLQQGGAWAWGALGRALESGAAPRG